LLIFLFFIILIYFVLVEGGAIHSDCNVTVEFSIFAGCWAGYGDSKDTSGGGGIAISHKTLTLSNSAFLFCESRMGRLAGAIRMQNSSIICTNCSWMNCVSSSYGGVVGSNQLHKGNITLTGCIFASNFAGGNGGAISSYPNTVTCNNCSFLHNGAATKGGAIYCEVDVNLTNCVFIRNIKSGDGTCSTTNMSSGGAILQVSGTLTLTDCTFNTNRNINNNCNGMFFSLIFIYLFFFLIVLYFFFFE
jgi:predicted outer membrane repeat protein